MNKIKKIVYKICCVLEGIIYTIFAISSLCFALYLGTYLLHFGWLWLILGIIFAPITPLILAIYQLTQGYINIALCLVAYLILAIIFCLIEKIKEKYE